MQLIPGKLYRSLARLPSSTGDLIPGELIQAWSLTNGQVAISRGERAKAPETLLSAETFFAHCELSPEAEENVRADMRENAPFIVLSGWREDVDVGSRPMRAGGAWLDLEEIRLLCEVLATGQTRRLHRHWEGRLWKLEWTLEDPRIEEAQVKTSLANQLLWFFPGGEDWTAFRMSCTTLIHGLGRELAWLLKLPEQPFRNELNALVVLLDQATLRVGL